MSDQDETDKPDDSPHDDQAPIEFWNINDQLEPVRIGPRIIGELRLYQLAAEQLAAELAQERAHKLSAKEVLEIFEERRKTDRKLQLKQVCDELGANYDSVRVAKSRLAKQGRRRKKK